MLRRTSLAKANIASGCDEINELKQLPERNERYLKTYHRVSYNF